MTDEALQNTSPELNLPGVIDGGYHSMSPADLAAYRTKFGRDPVPHQGPTGIKSAIDDIFEGHGFPYGQTLTPAQQQTLINELHTLYSQDAEFPHLKLWPATRDWLRRHFSGGSLNIPD